MAASLARPGKLAYTQSIMVDSKISLQDYPTPYSLKAIGDNRDEFAGAVFSLVQKHVPDLGPDALSVRPSAGGKFIAVTVTFNAQSREHLETIYAKLNDLAGVRVLL